MKAILTLGRTTLEFEGANFKDLIKQMAFAQELPDICPLCDAPVCLTYREPQNNVYYGMRCFGPVPHEVNLHQRKPPSEEMYYVASEWKVAYGYDAETGERQGGQQEPRREPARQEPPPEQHRTPALGDDPFAKRPTPQGSATGSAGPITEATLNKLMDMARSRPDLDFNQQSVSMFQRQVRDLTEAQAVALIYYLNTAHFGGAL